MKFPVAPVFLPALAGTVVLLMSGSGPALAAGSAEAGEAKAIVCTACHGPDGNSLNPEWPSLAGQNELYMVRTLQAFQRGERKNVLMTPQAMALSDQDMQDLAAYYSDKTRQPKDADPNALADGERLYRGGNKDTGVSACIACHGPQGNGNGPAGYPAISGQHASYVASQLHRYREGLRTSDQNQMMRNSAARLTDAEIDAVASYIQGLR